MVGRDALREYVRGSLWVLPTLSVLAALAAGTLLSSVSIGPRSPLAFQGTPDDARTLLLGITGTMVTVIALLLGLTVVALQLSSTQFSPRLLRSFLRDRPNQVVLSAFVATFAYSAAGLYTVGVSGGNRTAAFPRLAVSGAIVLLFISLGLLVFFADHFVHSIQVDAIMNGVQRTTLAVIEGGLLAGGPETPAVPAWAVPVTSRRSGYVQAARPGVLLPHAARHGICLRLRPRVGEHVVAGTTLAWIWPASPGDPAPDPRAFSRCSTTTTSRSSRSTSPSTRAASSTTCWPRTCSAWAACTGSWRPRCSRPLRASTARRSGRWPVSTRRSSTPPPGRASACNWSSSATRAGSHWSPASAGYPSGECAQPPSPTSGPSWPAPSGTS